MNFASGVIRSTTVAALAVTVAFPVGAAPGGSAGAVELSMSNFRFCSASACSPADQGYVRLPSGPVAGADNPHGIVDVPAGSTVRWVYRDNGPGGCDSFAQFAQCPGHDLRFEDGTTEGASMGYVGARRGPVAITATIGHPPGTLVRYFCSINNHYQTGMTGILRVV